MIIHMHQDISIQLYEQGLLVWIASTQYGNVLQINVSA